MKDDPDGWDESLHHRLSQGDRRIRRDQLRARIRELGGLAGGPEDEEVSEAELYFLESVVAWETGPRSSHRAWLARNDAKPEVTVKPQTGEEAEAQQARSDQLADRIEARLTREGEEHDDIILEEEIERLRRERGEPDLTLEQEAERAEWLEEMDRAAEGALANPDPEVEAELDYEHPLVKRVSELSLVMRRAVGKKIWRSVTASQEHPVSELLDATMIAGPKLAGGLNGRRGPPGIEFCAHTIVCPKRARGYLEDALRAAEACREDQLIPGTPLNDWVKELKE